MKDITERKVQEIQKAGMQKAPPLPARVRVGKMGRALVGKPKSQLRKTRFDSAVIHKEKYGHIRVDKRRMMRRGALRRYHCDCDCGRQVYLTAENILRRRRLHAGCMEIGCDVGPMTVRVWHDPEFCLWIQWSEILARCEEQVDNAWGGSLYEGIPSADQEEGFKAFKRDLDPLSEEGKRWVHKITKEAPYTRINVCLESWPSEDVFPTKELHTRYGSQPLKISELAEVFGLSETAVNKLRAKHADGEDLVRAMIASLTIG